MAEPVTLVGIIACIVVVGWLLATLLYQYGPAQVAIARWNPLTLLPSWAFFAPNPAHHDYHLLARELRADGSLGPCVAVSGPADRRLAHLVWNPDKRPQRVLQDAMQAVKRIRRWSHSQQVVQCSLPYLLLLHHATMQHRRGPDAVALQIIVVETSGREGKRVWISFLSGFHRL